LIAILKIKINVLFKFNLFYLPHFFSFHISKERVRKGREREGGKDGKIGKGQMGTPPVVLASEASRDAAPTHIFFSCYYSVYL
jgi:hypothetical protein